MSLLYWYYGMQAFRAQRLARRWSCSRPSARLKPKPPMRSAGEVCCLLWWGINPLDGASACWMAAKALRKARNPGDSKEFYEGLYYFFHHQTPSGAAHGECLRGSGLRPDITKLFAVVQLDLNQPRMGARLMAQFMQADSH